MKTTTKTEIKEVDLLNLLKAKDENAFNYLYHNYSKALLKGIHQLIPSKELAQDILHDAFIKIWLNVVNFDGEKASLYTWMSRIAQNTARDTFRSKENKLVAKCQELGESMQSVDNQYFTVIKTDDLGIMNAVNKLSSDRQQIIDLYYYKGYTANEIAKQKGLPIGTVKTRIHVAITELRKMVA